MLFRSRFEYPATYDPHSLFADSFGITSGPPEDVVARFTPDVALYVRERQWHPTQRIEALPDGGVRLRMRVAVSPELREWLLGFGAQVRVEAPAVLVDHVRDAHRAAAELYDR